jgi:hypothetical protein
MIIDLDPLFDSRHSLQASDAVAPTLAIHHHARAFSHAFQARAEREAAFERTHGSLWTHGLLDRLSLPLSRIHE